MTNSGAPADTHSHRGRHLHRDVVGVHRRVQPRPVVRRLAARMALPFARLRKLTLAPPGYALRVLVLAVLR